MVTVMSYQDVDVDDVFVPEPDVDVEPEDVPTNGVLELIEDDVPPK